VGFPLGYSHSHPIPKHTQQNNNEQMQTVDSRAAEKQFLRKLDINRNSKNTIHTAAAAAAAAAATTTTTTTTPV